MPKRKCGKGSCRTYIDYNETYCDKHKKEVTVQYVKTIRRNSDNEQFTEFYNSKQWRSLSRQKRAENPVCEHCLLEGRIRAAVLVDHIIEIKDDWSLRLEWSNLQSLCHECHNRKTKLEEKKRKNQGSDFNPPLF